MFRKSKPISQRSSPRGDTILSVMISVVIVGSVIGTTYHLVNSSLRLGRAGQERSYAVNVINIQIERIKAILDTNPKAIFEDSSTVLNTPNPVLGGFGDEFCLNLNETYSTLSNPVIDVKRAGIGGDPECQGVGIGFPVENAQPRVEIRYQEKHSDSDIMIKPKLANDRDRFEIVVHWIAIGTDREETLVDYYRSHPLILGP